jgi:hypothetical protein
MTETDFEVEIDETTGLPVVPEGFFWRVSDDPHYGDDPWVSLMERTMTDVEKPKKFLGIPTGNFKYVKEMGDVRVSSRGFEGYAFNLEEIPEGATQTKTSAASGGRTFYWYRDPVNDKTILARAVSIMKARDAEAKATAEYERLKAEREAVKDKYYGDYPPKTLK